MGKVKFSDDFKRDAVHQIAERGYRGEDNFVRAAALADIAKALAESGDITGAVTTTRYVRNTIQRVKALVGIAGSLAN
ncbi:MAG: hypothetical protein K8F25_16495 [Fimbriimonadaceae bacterium]|nr:hypothetical protein [Alphaproteobacteria bacterium]